MDNIYKTISLFLIGIVIGFGIGNSVKPSVQQRQIIRRQAPVQEVKQPQEVKPTPQQIEAKQQEARQRKVEREAEEAKRKAEEAESKESQQSADALICAVQLVKQDFYPAKLDIGFANGVFSARMGKGASDNWRVVNEFEANGFGRAYDCTVDISNDGCAGDCTYQ